MPKHKYYLIYEIEANEIKQAQAIASELFERSNIEPVGIFEKHNWDLKSFIDKLLKK